MKKIIIVLVVLLMLPLALAQDDATSNERLADCFDSDNGDQPTVKGEVFSSDLPDPLPDRCKTKTLLEEQLCKGPLDDGKYQNSTKIYNCSALDLICQNGACVQSETVETLPETGGKQ